MHSPEFTPGFNPDLLLHYDYLDGSVVLATDALREVGGLVVVDSQGVRDALLRFWDEHYAIVVSDLIAVHKGEEKQASPASDTQVARQVLARRGTKAEVQQLAYGPGSGTPLRGTPGFDNHPFPRPGSTAGDSRVLHPPPHDISQL